MLDTHSPLNQNTVGYHTVHHYQDGLNCNKVEEKQNHGKNGVLFLEEFWVIRQVKVTSICT